MEKERNVKRLSIIALVISVICLTIAFALVSSRLTINGSGNIKPASWNIHFDNLTSNLTGDAKIIKMPKINEDKNYIGDFEVALTKPGDSVKFCYDVVNAGTIDATLQTKIINGFDTNEVDDLNEVYKTIYVESDWNGDGAISDDEIKKSSTNVPVKVDFPNTLNANEVKNACMTISFEKDELPIGNVSLKMNAQGIYVQK